MFLNCSCYQKALVGNAATSALRLHQRLPSFRINREFMALFLMEDSCHYLMYSIIFLFNYPITLVLFPICLFAILHLSSYILVLLDKSGSRQGQYNPSFKCFHTNWPPIPGKFGLMLSSFVENYQRSILQMVALTEIILMPITIFALFGGVGSLFTPFIYYRFLSLRYGSRRNPYTRNMFHELRLQTQALIFKPACPAFIRNFIVKMIDLISKLAPPMSPTSSWINLLSEHTSFSWSLDSKLEKPLKFCANFNELYSSKYTQFSVKKEEFLWLLISYFYANSVIILSLFRYFNKNESQIQFHFVNNKDKYFRLIIQILEIKNRIYI